MGLPGAQLYVANVCECVCYYPASLLADLQLQKGPKITRVFSEMLSDWSKKALSRDHVSAALLIPSLRSRH
jgi:hypothetical protein